MSTDTGALPTGETAAPPPAPEAEQQKSAGQEQASESQQSEEQGTEGAEPRDEGKRKRGIGERALEYRNQARDTQRINERLIAVLERSLGGQAPKTDDPAGPPRREDFESQDAYLEAIADFKVAEAVRGIERRVSQARQQQARQDEIEKLESGWDIAKRKHGGEDFDDYVDEVGVKIPALAGVALKRSGELGVKIVRFLGDNPDELERISRLPEDAQLMELGEIRASLKSKAEPVKRPSKAPPPIEPVGSGKGSATTDPGQMSMAEYEAWRKKQGAPWAR